MIEVLIADLATLWAMLLAAFAHPGALFADLLGMP